MSRSRRDSFVLYMFEQDVINMKKWVLHYPKKETGGDLFGLWTAEGNNAVIHVVLGPGRKCTHGDYHFYQDVKYLEKVGNLLTKDYMLGHIGEWHSHHQLKLDEPSEGDCRTIEQNFPSGSCGFFLMIANIVSKDYVSFSPYIFKAGSRRCTAGQIKVFSEKSHFRRIPAISDAVNDGEEPEKGKQKSSKDYNEGRELQALYDPHTRGDTTMDLTGPGTSPRDITFPPNSGFQWYSENENLVNDIFYELRNKVVDLHITFEDRYLNMEMNFYYHGYEIMLFFPYKFPNCSASIYVNKKFKDLLILEKRDLNDFLELVKTFLQTKLNDRHSMYL